MSNQTEAIQAMLCTALEMKERKRALYEEGFGACPDQVGKETLIILRDAESELASQIQEINEEFKNGKRSGSLALYHLQPAH